MLVITRNANLDYVAKTTFPFWKRLIESIRFEDSRSLSQWRLQDWFSLECWGLPWNGQF